MNYPCGWCGSDNTQPDPEGPDDPWWYCRTCASNFVPPELIKDEDER